MTTKSNKQLLLQYAGFGIQLLFMLCILVAVGYYTDKVLLQQKPVTIIALPILGIVGMIVKVINDTKQKHHD